MSLSLLVGCKGIKGKDGKPSKDATEATSSKSVLDYSKVKVMDYANTITVEELKEQLYYYASDEMEGRYTGSPGQKRAVNYLRDQYKKMGVPGGAAYGEYFQVVPGKAFGKPELSSENVLAYIEGREFPDEVLVISAHLDHVGMEDGEVFNGADDDGSGTIALLEIAEAFKQAANDGYGPRRSILFLHVTGEEIGLKGSNYYANNPVYPMENTIADLNIDMIGRIDPAQKDNPDYVYLIGSDMLSQDLHDISEAANKKSVNMRLDYTYNGKNDPNRFYYRSDHYNFAKNNVPVIFYFNGVHEDYHKATDTADKIEYELYQRRIKLIFATAWDVANADQRPALK
ncbi:M28 family metallopeptidase [uncultured Nonlabens sp.]|uniref:M28 family metallopeptidase n=1 Tax=uncultured Nonlabens sp. TaxID=859306 RepID=UPI0030D71139|tara:strand:+ start:7784 stop:8812 length:1029 start_codon:yes stop_codon:yes gene_type:complete